MCYILQQALLTTVQTSIATAQSSFATAQISLYSSNKKRSFNLYILPIENNTLPRCTCNTTLSTLKPPHCYRVSTPAPDAINFNAPLFRCVVCALSPLSPLSHSTRGTVSRGLRHDDKDKGMMRGEEGEGLRGYSCQLPTNWRNVRLRIHF